MGGSTSPTACFATFSVGAAYVEAQRLSCVSRCEDSFLSSHACWTVHWKVREYQSCWEGLSTQCRHTCRGCRDTVVPNQGDGMDLTSLQEANLPSMATHTLQTLDVIF